MISGKWATSHAPLVLEVSNSGAVVWEENHYIVSDQGKKVDGCLLND